LTDSGFLRSHFSDRSLSLLLIPFRVVSANPFFFRCHKTLIIGSRDSFLVARGKPSLRL
jgi:hypothetical protein